jgi:hypothetical protein
MQPRPEQVKEKFHEFFLYKKKKLLNMQSCTRNEVNNGRVAVIQHTIKTSLLNAVLLSRAYLY